MNDLYFGDNLTVLRGFPDECVDLIYLDPPFNSNANYSHLFKDESGQVSGAQIEAFEDTWHWDDMVSGRALSDLRDSPYQDAADMLDAIVSVKGGRNLGVGMVRGPDAVVSEQKAQIGVFLTLHPPTRPMVDWARGAGTFEVEGFDPVARLQIVTVEQALDKGPRAGDTPLRHGSPNKKAAREQDTGVQGRLDV